jgi:hypothetical protein
MCVVVDRGMISAETAAPMWYRARLISGLGDQ